VLLPNRGVIYLGATAENTYLHGGDRRRKAAFSLEVVVWTSGLTVRRIFTLGTPLTYCIETTDELPIEVIRLHARRQRRDGTSQEHRIPREAIKRYLEERDE
jgi:hypothetical protein